MSTYRERRAERAEKLREWAAKREQRARATLNSQPELRHDWAFITQPGHIPERERMNRADDRAYRSLDKAQSMTARADGIEHQLAGAIYSDDPDAADQLRAKIERLEAERQRWTDYNKAARKSRAAVRHVDDPARSWDVRLDMAAIPADVLAHLDERQQREVLSLARHTAYNIGPNGQAPAYIGSNLSGNIRRLRLRLEQIEREKRSATDPAARPAGRYMVSRYAGECTACGQAFDAGTPIVYSRAARSARHYPDCGPQMLTCDVCDGRESADDLTPDWNGETGNHLSCEKGNAA